MTSPTGDSENSSKSGELWRNASSFVGLFRSMFEQRIDTDVTVKVELGSESKDVECHALILSAHSPVLRTMLSTRWNDANCNLDKGSYQRMITLKDDHPDYFVYFVKMMYQDWDDTSLETLNDIPEELTPETIVGVLALAHKYLANHIIRQSEHFINCYLSKRSASDIARLYSLLRALPICNPGQIARKTCRTVQNCLVADGEVVFSSDAVLNLNFSDLVHVLKDNQLRCPEQTVFDGCYKWAREKCKLKELDINGENLRSVLGDVINLIGFPLLDMSTITKVILPAKILTQEEMIELMAFKINTDYLNENITDNPIRFSCEERLNINTAFQIRRLDVNSKGVSKNLVDFSTPHGFIMTTSKEIMLSYLGFYGGDDNASTNYKFHVEIEILHEKFIRTERIEDVDNRQGKKYKNVYIDINPGIKIPAHTPVTIIFSITGGPTFVSRELVEDRTEEVTYWKNEIIITEFKSSPTVPNGLKQIPILQFSEFELPYSEVSEPETEEEEEFSSEDSDDY